MPLVYQQNINEHTKLGVWHIDEKEHFFLQKVPLQKEITHPHKRLQHLAGRYLLTELFPGFPLELIRIADTKKPFLENELFHFSISHSGEYAAVMVSTANRVGTDIEFVSDKAERIKHKFLSGTEQVMMQEIMKGELSISNNELFAFAWSIKEAMFKWHGLGGIDFRKHLQIDDLQITSNELLANCSFLKDGNKQLKIHGLSFKNNVLTWTVS